MIEANEPRLKGIRGDRQVLSAGRNQCNSAYSCHVYDALVYTYDGAVNQLTKGFIVMAFNVTDTAKKVIFFISVKNCNFTLYVKKIRDK